MTLEITDGFRISIGRVGIDVPLWVPSVGEWDGDTLSISTTVGGWVNPDGEDVHSVADSVVLVDQLRGLMETRDGVVHDFVCPSAPSQSGRVYVDSVSVKTDGASFAHGVFQVTMKLTRVRPGSRLESVLIHGRRPGTAVSAANSDPLFAVPPGTTTYRRNTTGLGSLTARALAPSSGGGNVLVDVWAGNEARYPAYWTCPPGAAHDGAARFRVGPRLLDGDTASISSQLDSYRTIVGRQVPGDLDVAGGWVLDNGLVRVYPWVASQSVSNRGFAVESWSGTAWESRTVLYVANVDASAVTIRRNSPEVTAITLLLEGDGSAMGLSLRRGDRLLAGTMSNPGGSALLAVDAGGASQSITGGVRLTSNDADGNRWVLASGAGTLTAAASGPPYFPSAGTASGPVDFGFGHEIGGSGSSGIETAQALANQYAAFVDGPPLAVRG